MGRIHTQPGLFVWALAAALSLAACGGQKQVPLSALSADEQAASAAQAGPLLRGAGGADSLSTPTTPTREAAQPEVALDQNGTLLIPRTSADSVSWGSVSWGGVARALNRSAEFRRKREGLKGRPGMLVPLPGDYDPKTGTYLRIGCEIEVWSAGLLLCLEQDRLEKRTHIRARGSTWGPVEGCEGILDWKAPGWSLPLWQTALDGLNQLKAKGERHVVIQADDEVPATEVITFIRAAREAGIEHVHVEPDVDVAAISLGWLAAHQLKNGGWNAEYPGGSCNDAALGHAPTSRRVCNEPALSGLALYALLASGYTNRGKHPLARIVSKGLRFLKNVQTSDGQYAPGTGAATSRDHAWAALAMVQIYGMTGSAIFRGSAQRALDYLETNWRAAGDDPLVTVLAAMALSEARLTNENAHKRGRPTPLWVRKRLGALLRTEAGSLSTAEDSLSRAAGLLSRVLLGEEPRESPKILAGSRRLATSLASAEEAADPCLMWLASLLAYRAGTEHGFATLRQAHTTFVLKTLRRDGPACCFYGSWDPRPDPTVAGGRVAATALLALLGPIFFQASHPR